MLIDSHVNLHAEQFEGEVSEIIARAFEAGVSGMLTISDRLENIHKVTALSEQHKAIWHSVGVHPHYAKDAGELNAQTLVKLAEHERAIGIGECGLDYHYEYSDRPAQKRVFDEHIKAAQKTGLPLIIHTRNADEDMRQRLAQAHDQDSFTPLMHCYTSGKELAETALELGGYIAFSGILTFKNAHEVRAVAQATPLDRIIIETDCPYLAPVPMRGRRNEPAYLTHVADYLADLKGISPEEVAQKTTDNFFRLFSKADRGEIDG